MGSCVVALAVAVLAAALLLHRRQRAALGKRASVSRSPVRLLTYLVPALPDDKALPDPTAGVTVSSCSTRTRSSAADSCC